MSMPEGERRFRSHRRLPQSVRRATQFAPIAPRNGLHAAAVWVDLTPALGVRMGGFGMFRGYPTQRFLGRLGATLLLLDDGYGKRLLLIASDLHAGNRYIGERVAAALAPWLGIAIQDVWMLASHAHTGPANIYAESIYDLMAARSRGFDTATCEWLIEALVDGARDLGQALLPARLGSAQTSLSKLFWNRSVLATLANRAATERLPLRSLVTNPLGLADKEYARHFATQLAELAPFDDRPVDLGDIRDIAEHLGRWAVDPRLQLLHVTRRDASVADSDTASSAAPNDTPIASIGLIHATPTVLGPTARCLSGDVTAYAASLVRRHWGKTDLPVSIVGGAIADANVIDPARTIGEFREYRKDATPLQLADMVGDVAPTLAQALCHAQRHALLQSRSDVRIETRMSESLIPGTRLQSGGRLPETIKVGKTALAGSELLRAELSDMESMFEEPSYDRFVQKRRVVRTPGRGPHSPKRGTLTVETLATLAGAREAVRVMTPYLQLRWAEIGDLRLLAVPAEPTLGLASELRRALGQRADSFFLFGLAGGYLGYATTALEYCVQDYEGASSYWGRHFGEMVLEKSVELARGAQQPLAPVADFATRNAETGPLIHLKATRKSPRAEPEEKPGCTREGVHIKGVWFSALPANSDEQTPIAKHRVIVRLTKNGQPWIHHGLEINDRNYSFLIERRLRHDDQGLVWTFYVACKELPLHAATDKIGFDVMADGVFRPLGGHRHG